MPLLRDAKMLAGRGEARAKHVLYVEHIDDGCCRRSVAGLVVDIGDVHVFVQLLHDCRAQ